MLSQLDFHRQEKSLFEWRQLCFVRPESPCYVLSGALARENIHAIEAARAGAQEAFSAEGTSRFPSLSDPRAARVSQSC